MAKRHFTEFGIHQKRQIDHPFERSVNWRQRDALLQNPVGTGTGARLTSITIVP